MLIADSLGVRERPSVYNDSGSLQVGVPKYSNCQILVMSSNPDALPETFDLGLRDSRRFALALL